jgi:P-type Cu+ transporter
MREVTLGIDGMTCSSCSNTVQNALRSLGGVKLAQVNLTTNTALVEYEPHSVTVESLIDEVCGVGFDAEVLQDKSLDQLIVSEKKKSQTNSEETSSIHRVILGIEGMSCSSCTGTVENTIKSIKGVNASSVIVALTTNSASFTFDASLVSINTIVDEVECVGFGAEVMQDDVEQEKSSKASPGDSSSTGTTQKVDANAGVVKSLLVVLEVAQGTNATATATTATASAQVAHGTIRLLTEEIQALEGVQAATASADDAQIKVTFDDSLTGPRDFHRLAASHGLAAAISSLGGFMMATRLMKTQAQESKKLLHQLLLASLLTVPIMCITMVFPMIPGFKGYIEYELFPGLAVNGILLLLLSFPVQFYVGNQFHSKAWKSLKTYTLGMDFMVSTGTMAAYLYSTAGLVIGVIEGVPNTRDVEYFETSAVLITAVLLGKYLEVYAKGHTAAAIHKLSKLKANTARLVKSGTTANEVKFRRAQSLYSDNPVIHSGGTLLTGCLSLFSFFFI